MYTLANSAAVLGRATVNGASTYHHWPLLLPVAVHDVFFSPFLSSAGEREGERGSSRRDRGGWRESSRESSTASKVAETQVQSLLKGVKKRRGKWELIGNGVVGSSIGSVHFCGLWL